MTRITKEQALLLQDWAEQEAEKQIGMKGEWHPDQWKLEAHLLCQAAIDWAAKQGEAPKECKCSMRTKLVGDGCSVCNPEFAAELAEQVNQEHGELVILTDTELDEVIRQQWGNAFMPNQLFAHRAFARAILKKAGARHG